MTTSEKIIIRLIGSLYLLTGIVFLVNWIFFLNVYGSLIKFFSGYYQIPAQFNVMFVGASMISSALVPIILVIAGLSILLLKKWAPVFLIVVFILIAVNGYLAYLAYSPSGNAAFQLSSSSMGKDWFGDVFSLIVLIYLFRKKRLFTR